MRAAWYARKGPAADVLEVGDQPTPVPGPGEVLVRVRASGVNPSDTKGRAGTSRGLSMPFPLIIPHQDGAGEVVAAGSSDLESRVGERVWFYEAQLLRPHGAAAEFVAIPAVKAVRLPDAATFEAGACLGMPAMTAHRAVFADGPVEGQTVFVSGGGGAVGRYAVPFAKQAGARVIATVGNARTAASARAAGADLVLDRTREDIAAQVTVCTRLDFAYERNQHEQLALRLGFSEAWIGRLTNRSQLAPLSEAQSDVQALVFAVLDGDAAAAREKLAPVIAHCGPETATALLFQINRFSTICSVGNIFHLKEQVKSIFDD